MTGLLETYGEGTYGGGHYGGEPTTGAAFMVEVERTPGVWQDVVCDVRTIAVDRGRSRQLDSFSAATLQLELADEDAYYNAWNPVGIWSANGQFRTDVGIRVRAVLGYTTSSFFTGTTDDVADSWPNTGADSLTQVRATDSMKGLARARPVPVAAVGAGELPGARVNRILDAVSYAGPRNVETGTITMAATTLDGTAVDLCDEARESEWGNFYVDREGVVRFRARDSSVTDTRQSQVQFVFTDRHGDNLTPAPPHPTILEEPFNTLTNWTSGSPTLVSGRNGTALQQSGSGAPVYTTPTDYGSQWTIGFAYRNQSLAAVRLFAQVRNDIADNAISIQANTDGSIVVRTGGVAGPVLGTTAAGLLAANVWAYIEVSVTCAEAPGGAVTLRVNGTTVLTLTGVDTHGAGSTSLRALALNGGAAGGVAQYDDLYITTGAFMGDQVLPIPPPAAAVPEGCYSDLTLIATDDAVYNRVSIQRIGGTTPQVASVADSLSWYGPRTYTRTNMSCADDAGALTLAQTIAAQHAYNERRVDEIVFHPLAEPALLAIALDLRMLDRVRVIRHAGVVIDAELQVQAIHHTITGGGDGSPGTWECRLETTNARLIRDAGQWDVGGWDVAKWSV